jgi:hypothetical protein
VKFVKKKIRKKGIISNLPLQNIREWREKNEGRDSFVASSTSIAQRRESEIQMLGKEKES